MNVLVFSGMAWDNNNSLGNTMSNLFDGKIWENDNFYHIYMRNIPPNNNVCKDYYRMTLIDMIKHPLSKNKIGNHFIYNNYTKNEEIKSNKDQKYIDFIHKHSLKKIYSIADNVYRKKNWLNNNFISYINHVKPDIFFAFLTDVSILCPIVEYLKNNTNTKIILFAVDDVYSSYTLKSTSKRKKLEKEFKSLVNMADKLYGISDLLCDYYSQIFSKEFNILHKGCSFVYPEKNKKNTILRIVYAGNLFYGRDKILSKIAKSIDEYNNKSKNKVHLEIYTGDTITSELENELNINDSSKIMGKRDYDEIKKIEHEADYMLHVESFIPENIKSVKYSFSTKIMDYLQSSSCLIGIGPKNIASIEYIRNIPGAYVIDELDDLEIKITKIIEDNNIIENSKKIRDYSIKNLDIKVIQSELRKDFI